MMIQGTRTLHLFCIAGVLTLLTLPSGARASWVIPATVEDVVRESDLIVLGRVIVTDPEAISVGPSNQLFTRHTLAVESYYKGSGQKKISLLTHGGFWTKRVGGEEHRQWAQVMGAIGAKEGEEFLAFLTAAPGGYEGYMFVEWDGAKYLVNADAESGERTIEIRLRKKKYMKGIALDGFERLERRRSDHANPTAQVEKELLGSRGITDTIALAELRTRLEEIIQGETEVTQ